MALRDYQPQGTIAPDQPRDHERESTVDVRLVLVSLGILVAIGLFVHFALAGLLRAFVGHPAGSDALTAPETATPFSVTASQVPPAPRLQMSPEQELLQFRAEENAVLGSYAWQDRAHGVVRIPIEQAKTLLLQRGLPSSVTSGSAVNSDSTNGGGVGVGR